ncbi:MAG: hypothetical protein K0R43_3777 [Pseudoduganella sp.]|nr:hypothetical protein [Pseudoduganella sp.]
MRAPVATAMVRRNAFDGRHRFAGVVEQPALHQRLRGADGCRQGLLRGGMPGQLQLGVEDLAHLEAERVGQVGAHQAVVAPVVGRAVEQVELGGEFDVAQRDGARIAQQEVELADGAVAAVAHLQAVRRQHAALGKVEGHQLFSVQAQAGIEALAQRGVQRCRVGIEVGQPVRHRRAYRPQRGDPALPVRAGGIEQVGRVEQPRERADVGPREVAPLAVEGASVGRHGRLWQGTSPAMPWPCLPAAPGGRTGGRSPPPARCRAT